MNTLAVTCGDAAGVGPELALRALAMPPAEWGARLAVYGGAGLLRRVAASAGLPWPAGAAESAPGKAWPETGHVVVSGGADAALETVTPGRVQETCGRRAHAWVCDAVRDIMDGRAQGLVTAPASKLAMRMAGVGFPGHTELLAHLARAPEVRMMFWSERLRVVLETIHTPLSEVPRMLSRAHLAQTLRMTARALGTPRGGAAKIGVLALNPHAGEGGLFGREEADVLAPAIADARAEGLDVAGPLVPDTAFCWLGEGKPAPFDAWVAMHHDQGLTPFKMAAFREGVNMTLGLPFARTSPDHGTAFDLAWQGKADPGSFFAALRLASRMVNGTALSSPVTHTHARQGWQPV